MGRSEFTLSRERYKYLEDAMERHDAASRPAPQLPIPCTYCGGPIGADEDECPECRAKAVRCERCGGGHLACLPVEPGVLTALDPPIVGIPITELARKP